MSFEKIEAICGKADAEELRELKAKVDQLVNGPFASRSDQKEPAKQSEPKSSK